MSHFEAMRQTQEKLLEVYEQLGKVVGKLPLRIGDVLSEEPLELFDRTEHAETEQQASSLKESKETKGTE